MLKRIRPYLGNHFLRSSFTVLAGAMVVNILNYLFTVIMARLMVPAQYGEVATLMALSAIMAVPGSTVVTLSSRYVAELKARNEMHTIDAISALLSRYLVVAGCVCYGLFLAATPLLSQYFHIAPLPFVIFGAVFPLGFLSATYTGMLQGLQAFLPYSLLGIISTTIKLVLAVVFVLIGWQTAGVMGAFILGYVCLYTYGVIAFKRYIRFAPSKHAGTVPVKFSYKQISPYMVGVFTSTLLLSMYTNVDITLAKHYLTPTVAGEYAALFVSGNIVSYAATALCAVMFPLVAHAHASGASNAKRWFGLSLSLILCITVPILLLYTFFPTVVLRFIYGQKYLMIAPFLIYYGLAMFLGTIINVFTNYFMAIKEQRYIMPLVFFIGFEVVLIAKFHSSILTITWCVLLTSLLLALSMATVFLLPAKKTVHGPTYLDRDPGI